MATNMLSAACLRILFLIMTVSTKSINHMSIDQENIEVDKVLKTIDKLLNYYRLNVMNLNLDGFFGVRVLEGHMLGMLKEYKSGLYKNIPGSVWQNISRLAKTATTISEEGMEFVRKDNPNYFNDFSSLVDHPWAFFKKQRRLDPNLRWEIPQYKAKLQTHLSEKLSDKCLKEVIISSSTNCNVSKLCLKTMASRGLTGYGITHQLLWSIIVELSTQCTQPIETALKSYGMESLESLQLEMCTNNFYEMIAVVHVLMKGKIHESHQDLFLEQQFVCPSLGFYEFIKKDYLDQILSWQYASGCFGDTEEEENTSDDNDAIIGSLLETYHKKGDEKHQAIRKVDNIQIMRQRDIKSFGSMKDGENYQVRNQDQKPTISATVIPSERIKVKEASYNDRISGQPKSILQGKSNETWNSASNYGRKLLVEKRLKGDCLSHKTGVAAGALSVYLRYLIQPGDIKWDGPHELFEIDRQNVKQSDNKPEIEYSDNIVVNNDDDADSDENVDDEASFERGKEEKEIQTHDYREYHSDYGENVKENDLILSTRPALIQNERLKVQKQNHKSNDDDSDNTFSNVLYSNVEEEHVKSSQPGALLFILVSLSPMVLIMFFLFKVLRRYRILRLCF